MIVVYFIGLVAAIAIGSALGARLNMWMIQRETFRCAECKARIKKGDGLVFTFNGQVCQDCARKQAESAPPLPIGGLAPSLAQDIKQIYSDPEVIKALKKGFGFQTERERFEDEAREGD